MYSTLKLKCRECVGTRSNQMKIVGGGKVVDLARLLCY